MNAAGRPARRPTTKNTNNDSAQLSRCRGQPPWDDPSALDDDALMVLVRATLAVDRAVDGYRGKRAA
jgi:hypothetical protein